MKTVYKTKLCLQWNMLHIFEGQKLELIAMPIISSCEQFSTLTTCANYVRHMNEANFMSKYPCKIVSTAQIWYFLPGTSAFVKL